MEPFQTCKLGMEPLDIDWDKEEPKMGQIIRQIYVIANNSIFKSILLSRSIALRERYPTMNPIHFTVLKSAKTQI